MRALKAWVFGAAFAAVLAMPQAPSGAGGPYEFPSEAETILSEVPIQKTFSCDNQVSKSRRDYLELKTLTLID